jgi:hypothetical protein
VEPVDRLPDDLVVPVADDVPDPPVDAAVAFFLGDVEPVGHLPVDAEDRARAGVDEHLAAGVPLRVEVEAALVLPARDLRADVADEEVVLEGPAGEGQPELRTQRVTAGAAAGDDVRGVHGDRVVAGPAGDHHSLVVLRDTDHVMAPSHVDERGRGDPLVEDLLGARLGDVDEGREGRAAPILELDREQLVLLVEGAGQRPGQALGGDLLAGTDR